MTPAPDGQVACPGCWTLRARGLDRCACGEVVRGRPAHLSRLPGPFAIARAAWLRLTGGPDAAAAARERAERLIRELRPAEALVAAREAAARAPTELRGQELVAQALAQAGEHEAAAEAIERALRFMQGDPGLLSTRAEIRQAAGEVASARDDLTEALRADPTWALLWSQRGHAHEALRCLNEAERDHREATRVAPRDLEAWRHQTAFLCRRERAAEALSSAASALAIAPGNPGALRDRGWARMVASDLTGAETDLDEAVKLAPQSWLPRATRARLRADQERFDEAVKDAEAAVTLARDTSRAPWRVLADVCAAEGNHAAAFEAMGQAWEVSRGRDPAAALSRAVLVGRGGSFEAALAYLDQLPELPEALRTHALQTRAIQRWRLDDMAGACQAATAAVEAAPSDPEARGLRAHLRALSLDGHGARADLARLVDMQSHGLNAVGDRAAVRDLLGERQAAEADWRHFLTQAEEEPEVAARTLVWAERHADARELASRLCLRRPRNALLWHALALAQQALGEPAADARARAEALDRAAVTAWDPLAHHRARRARARAHFST